MTVQRLYPLSFDPIFQYRLWGGRRLGPWMRRALPGNGPIGEAWLLSDLSPEALTCDGELRGAKLLAKSRMLNQAKADLEAMGQKVEYNYETF